MLKTLGIIEACFDDDASRTRVTRKLRGKTVLEWAVRRATDSLRLDGVIVVADSDPRNTFVLELVPLDVPVFIARRPDALARVAAALDEYPAEGAVRIRAEQPFVDPGLIDRLVSTAHLHPGCDYASFCLRDGRPAIHSAVGVFAEWFKVSALHRAARKATQPAERREPTRYLYSHPELFSVRLIPAPAQIDRDDLRLGIDAPEDWENALAILDALGSEEFDWQRIADLLDHQPTLRRRMADLNRSAAAN